MLLQGSSDKLSEFITAKRMREYATGITYFMIIKKIQWMYVCMYVLIAFG